jgi:microsomal dipeptidase-like Zn-dependent dipeptidase
MPRRLACVCALILAAIAALPAAADASDARYALAGGCYALRSEATGQLAAKTPDGGYTALADGKVERLRMKATALGSYMLYGAAGDFVGAAPITDRVETQLTPSARADWRVDDAGSGTFRIALPAAGKVLVTAVGGRLQLAPAATAGRRGLFSFRRWSGCAAFPEVETNAVGRPSRGAMPFGEVRGLLDAHMHMMAFEFLGGKAHCGKPWAPFGVTVALHDCPDHYPNGSGAVLENTVSYGNPVGTHDPVGWPTFKDWPNPASLTHELSYYKWVERAWRGGLRVYVNLLVENKVLCEAYPLKQNSCDEMDAVRLQARRIHQLQNYIDAQYGGPGKGWFRIVTNPFQARRAINRGKLAVVLGIEVSEPFGCQVFNEQPMCTVADIDRGLDEVYRLGVRDMEIVNKFDNALAGVAGDTGSTGAVVNQGNKAETGKYWQMQHCTGPKGANDREQPTPFTHNDDDLLANGLDGLGGAAPVYGPPPHCNARGLTSLGAHAVRRMIAKRMMIDPDHLSVRARDQLLTIVEKAHYGGLVSSHSWSTVDAYPRIYKLGGVITPYAGDSTSFVKEWRVVRRMRDRRFYWGLGYGADMNGFGHQGGPREGAGRNPVRYPFRSFDGKVTLGRQHSGKRVFDINKDGVANYGLYPDWVEDLRKIAGDRIVRDMARGPEAYLQMWERSQGVPATYCQRARARVRSGGVAKVPLGVWQRRLLRSAGQPRHRPGRVWRFCVKGGKRRVTAVLTPRGRVALVASTARRHRARGVGPGARAARLGVTARRALVVRRAGGGARFVYGVRGGRVRWVAVTRLRGGTRRAYLRRAGLR